LNVPAFDLGKAGGTGFNVDTTVCEASGVGATPPARGGCVSPEEELQSLTYVVQQLEKRLLEAPSDSSRSSLEETLKVIRAMRDAILAREPDTTNA
jgi:hypothetical protein